MAAPEIENYEIHPKHEFQAPLNEINPAILSLKPIRKVMKVNHIQATEKAMRKKSQRYLNKMNKTGPPEEIKEVEMSLEEA